MQLTRPSSRVHVTTGVVRRRIIPVVVGGGLSILLTLAAAGCGTKRSNAQVGQLGLAHTALLDLLDSVSPFPAFVRADTAPRPGLAAGAVVALSDLHSPNVNERSAYAGEGALGDITTSSMAFSAKTRALHDEIRAQELLKAQWIRPADVLGFLSGTHGKVPDADLLQSLSSLDELVMYARPRPGWAQVALRGQALMDQLSNDRCSVLRVALGSNPETRVLLSALPSPIRSRCAVTAALNASLDTDLASVTSRTSVGGIHALSRLLHVDKSAYPRLLGSVGGAAALQRWRDQIFQDVEKAPAAGQCPVDRIVETQALAGVIGENLPDYPSIRSCLSRLVRWGGAMADPTLESLPASVLGLRALRESADVKQNRELFLRLYASLSVADDLDRLSLTIELQPTAVSVAAIAAAARSEKARSGFGVSALNRGSQILGSCSAAVAELTDQWVAKMAEGLRHPKAVDLWQLYGVLAAKVCTRHPDLVQSALSEIDAFVAALPRPDDAHRDQQLMLNWLRLLIRCQSAASSGTVGTAGAVTPGTLGSVAELARAGLGSTIELLALIELDRYAKRGCAGVSGTVGQ